jgi:prepilin-type N-terminal cleavage/methylation domain-containing protein
MQALNRRGFTLIELLIALVIGAVVGAATARVIRGTQRTTEAGIQQVDLHQNLRAGMGYITSIVRELDAEEGDISIAGATQLRFRSMRWASPLCDDPVAGGGTTVTLLLDAGTVFGVREPDEVEDSVLIYADGNTNTRTDDTWLAGALTRKVRTGTCPSGSTAITLTVEVTAASGGQAAALADVLSGAPVRGFQWEQLSLYQGTDARWWLGQETADRSGTISPQRALVGPLMANGLTFQYYDSTGAVTGTLANIASIEVTLRAESSSRVRTAASNIDYARDSIITRVALRNNPRY